MTEYIIGLCDVTGWLLSAFCCYWVVYTIVGAFTTRRFPKTENRHRYAVVIAARNEEQVLGHLLNSIAVQDYPRELVSVFVVADNCTDATAQVARSHGAVCYERQDTKRCTKGYALQFLFDRIRRDYGIDQFEGYFIFDADNLLKADYISRMNEAFDAGERVITSYRNTKNFSQNWISAAWGLHWLRTIRLEHRARSVFHLATRIQGTGLLVGRELLMDGWNYTCLTEDRELSADAVLAGYAVSYCDAAEFYDEQPTSLRIAVRQRNRWSKGHLQVLKKSGWKLLRGVFTGKGLRQRFMAYDMFFICFPRSLTRVIIDLVRLLAALWLWLATKESFGVFGGALVSWFAGIGSRYLSNIFAAVYVFLTEGRRIEKMPWYRYIWSCLMFPLFDVIGRISMVYALFMRVDWKPIPHSCAVTIEQMET